MNNKKYNRLIKKVDKIKESTSDPAVKELATLVRMLIDKTYQDANPESDGLGYTPPWAQQGLPKGHPEK